MAAFDEGKTVLLWGGPPRPRIGVKIRIAIFQAME